MDTIESLQSIQQPQMSSNDFELQVNQMENALARVNRARQLMFQILHHDVSVICNICLESKSPFAFFKFCCEAHQFCNACIESILRNAINDSKTIKCPMQQCGIELTEVSPYFKSLQEASKLKYLKIIRNRDILLNPNIKMCSKVDCQGLIQISPTKMQCNLCNQQYCLKCRQFLHDGKCDSLIAKSMQRKYKYRKCPQCLMVVQKNEGCDHMTCICTHQFCYRCGQSFRHGGHVCKKPQHLKGFAAFRWHIQRQPTQIQSMRFINLSGILYRLQPDSDHSTTYRCIYTLLFVLTLYPLLVVSSVSLILLAITLYLALAIVAITFYFIILPLVEILHLQLAPARFLRRKNLPKPIVRLLMIPLYPINFLFGIKDKSDFFTCQNQMARAASLCKIIGFFIALPFLINAEST